MAITLRFAAAIDKSRARYANDKAERALDRMEVRMADRAALAALEGRFDYRPRRYFRSDLERQLAKQRDREELEAIKRATGVRPYIRRNTDEERRAAIQESNRRASQKRRDAEKAAAA